MNQTPDFDRLDRALAKWPRVTLTHTPTPLEHLPRLSAQYPAHSLMLKRDDCTGLAMGGNKARQLEFYLGDAQAQGCDTVLSTGAVQSNYMRMLAAAAAKLGFECHIQLETRVKSSDTDYLESGNVLLDKLFGAHIHSYAEGEDEHGADKKLKQIADQLAADGKQPYIVPLAPVEQPKGALGYALAAKELAEQFMQQGIEPDMIAVGSGSGLTHAGLLTGFRTLGMSIPVIGMCVRRAVEAQYPRVLSTCRKLERMLGVDEVVKESDVEVSDLALAPGYGQVSPKVVQTIQDAAALEGILLDPVYSAKTVAGTLIMLESGMLEDKSNIVMIHTGGTPALFAYRKQILSLPEFGL